MDVLDEDISHRLNEEGLDLSKIGQTMTTLVDEHRKNTMGPTDYERIF